MNFKQALNLSRFRNEFWFDVETTGLDYKLHSTTQLSYIIVKSGEVVKVRDIKMQPDPCREISEEALKAQGITMDELMNHPYTQQDGLTLFRNDLRDVGSLQGTTSLMPMGYNNAQFDADFLKRICQEINVQYGKTFSFNPVVDVMHYALSMKKIAAILGRLSEEAISDSNKLGVVYALMKSMLNEPLPAIKFHDALEDIKATMEIFYRLPSAFFGPVFPELETIWEERKARIDSFSL